MPRILLVEDNDMNRDMLSRRLIRSGYEVSLAVDGQQGADMALSEQPDLILMDIQLPGMDGLEATAVLKSDDTTRAIPVIALTALAMKGDEERILAAGCDGYIAKPLEYKEFLAKVGRRLDGGPFTPARARTAI
jgi:two-component system cell cycle response regulator DivK